MSAPISDPILGSSRFPMPGAWVDSDDEDARAPAPKPHLLLPTSDAAATDKKKRKKKRSRSSVSVGSISASDVSESASGATTPVSPSRTPPPSPQAPNHGPSPLTPLALERPPTPPVAVRNVDDSPWLQVPRKTHARRLSAVERELKLFQYQRWAKRGDVLLDPASIDWIPCNLDNHHVKHGETKGVQSPTQLQANFANYSNAAVRLHCAPVSETQWGFVDRVDAHVYRYDTTLNLLSIAAPNGFILTAFTPQKFDRHFRYIAPDNSLVHLFYGKDTVGLQACYLAALNVFNTTLNEREPKSIKQLSGPERTEMLERVLSTHGIRKDALIEAP